MIAISLQTDCLTKIMFTGVVLFEVIFILVFTQYLAENFTTTKLKKKKIATNDIRLFMCIKKIVNFNSDFFFNLVPNKLAYK